jgi:diadenosine tetraphosphatase ApaH/serine/threonine PP2A family protein phosphatase
VKIAVFSDVHGNLEALEAVLATEAFRSADRVICLGDVIGYGADPSDCLARSREVAERLLLGNHESAVAHPQELAFFNGYARRAIEWTRDRLSEAEREFIASLPYLHREPPDLLFVHAAPTDPPAWEYIIDFHTALREMSGFTERLCFVGHSHVPLAVEAPDSGQPRPLAFPLSMRDGAKYLVNVGSVGQPRDGDPRAAFALLDTDARSVALHRVEYPIAVAQEKILAADLPAYLAARLARGR